MTHLRPIPLCNVLIKVVSKVIANRVKLVLPKLIKENQTSFIPGRQGINNIVIAQETIHSIKQKRGKMGCMAIKLDLEKAYDRLE